MASGVKVDPTCLEAFNEFKLGKKYAYIVFGFTEKNDLIIVTKSEPLQPPKDATLESKNAQWQSLVSEFQPDKVGYAVADVHYNSSNGEKTEMVFLTWAPDTAPIKGKMIVASSKDALKKALVGIRTSIQATCYPDIELRSIVEACKGTL